MACSLVDKFSKLFDMASHLFLWAGLSCAQWVAKGASAFFCEPFKLCQVEFEAEAGRTDDAAEGLLALSCVACAKAAVPAVLKTTTRQLAMKRGWLNRTPLIGGGWPSKRPRNLGRYRLQGAGRQ